MEAAGGKSLEKSKEKSGKYNEYVNKKLPLSKDDPQLEINMGEASKSSTHSNSPDLVKDSKETETVEQLKTQLGVLMNSLATLSAEKSKMEANFQVDRKQLRSDREDCEKLIKDLKERLKRAQSRSQSDVEHIKCKLIMERHEREKEQADHSAMIKELQRLLNDERRTKEYLESQMKELKNQSSNKGQCKILEAELEATKLKLKQAEAAAKETPPLLISLQTEMAAMRRQHRNAIHEEQKRAAAAEQRARVLAMTHEARVVGLEARLAELSETVGGYDRMRQQDQRAIQNLKDQLAGLRENERRDLAVHDSNEDPKETLNQIKSLYAHLLDLDNKKNSSAYVKELLRSLSLCDINEISDYKERYESLLQEFEEYKATVLSRHQNSKSNDTSVESNERKGSDKTEIHLLKTHCRNLEERIRTLNSEKNNKDKEFKAKLEQQQELFEQERLKHQRAIAQKENEFRGKIASLEQQISRQRERSLLLIEEKDQEISTLRASFHAIVPKKDSVGNESTRVSSAKIREGKIEQNDLVTGLMTMESPPMFHYAQELARREVQVSALRKRNVELEGVIRELQRDVLHTAEKHKEEIKELNSQITRLEACKSREGANLEYLKNVFLNYLTSSDSASKRHMLNAISTVLRFTTEETEKIRSIK